MWSSALALQGSIWPTTRGEMYCGPPYLGGRCGLACRIRSSFVWLVLRIFWGFIVQVVPRFRLVLSCCSFLTLSVTFSSEGYTWFFCEVSPSIIILKALLPSLPTLLHVPYRSLEHVFTYHLDSQGLLLPLALKVSVLGLSFNSWDLLGQWN